MGKTHDLHEQKEAMTSMTRTPLGTIDAASLRDNRYVKYDAKGDVIPFYRRATTVSP